MAIKPPTYRIYKCEGRVEARLLASNLLAIRGPSNNRRYEMCGVVRAYRRLSSPMVFSSEETALGSEHLPAQSSNDDNDTNACGHKRNQNRIVFGRGDIDRQCDTNDYQDDSKSDERGLEPAL